MSDNSLKLDFKTIYTLCGIAVFVWYVAVGIYDLKEMITKQADDSKYSLQSIQDQITLQNEKTDDRFAYIQNEIDKGCGREPDPKKQSASSAIRPIL